MKIIAFAALLCTFLSSCSSIGPDGRRWLQIPMPPDPLREAVIRALSEKPKTRAPVTTQVTASKELPPPPSGYMFSVRRTASGYEIRGITGSVGKMSPVDYVEFSTVAKEKGWLVYQY